MSQASALSDERLRSLLLSYTFAQGDDLHKNINDLQEFLQASGLGMLDVDELREKVDLIKEEEKKIKHDQETMANLFTENKKVRTYRFGSSFCPKCNMFKNYEKECPYCKYLEMTI